jgi:hypothetical protein
MRGFFYALCLRAQCPASRHLRENFGPVGEVSSHPPLRGRAGRATDCERVASHAPTPSYPAMPDIAHIDTLVGNFFRCFDNRDGRRPVVAGIVRLFAEAAVISLHRAGALELYSPGEFAAPRVQLLTGGTLIGFHEWEAQATTRVVGPMATRVSAYAKEGRLEGVLFSGRGTKVFQFVRDAAEWRILALSWCDDCEELGAAY